VSLRLLERVVPDAQTAERLRPFPLGAGAMALVDRGYGPPAARVETHQPGAEWLGRWNSGMPLWPPTGAAFDLAGTWPAVPPPQAIVPYAVQVGPAGTAARVAASLQACRLPAAHATAARRRCRQRAQQSGKTLKAATRYLAGWGVVVTTRAAAGWPAATILALYRVRWHVELAIKRWKSRLDVGRLRAKAAGTLASLWVQGKFL
jgi:hypothetical protein